MARLLEIPIKADLIKKSTNTYSINADSTGVYFKIDILKNGEKFDLTDKTVRAYMLKKDKKVIYIDCTLENKNDELECFLDVTTQMLNAEYLTVQFLITDTEGSTVVSNPVYIAIGDTVIDTEAIESSSEFSALQSMINSIASGNYQKDVTDAVSTYISKNGLTTNAKDIKINSAENVSETLQKHIYEDIFTLKNAQKNYGVSSVGKLQPREGTNTTDLILLQKNRTYYFPGMIPILSLYKEDGTYDSKLSVQTDYVYTPTENMKIRISYLTDTTNENYRDPSEFKILTQKDEVTDDTIFLDWDSTYKNIGIYMKTKEDWLEYTFKNASRNSTEKASAITKGETLASCYNMWRQRGVYRAIKCIDNSFINPYPSDPLIHSVAEWEMAIKEVIGGTEQPDFVGGMVHGDEVTTSIVFMVDGKIYTDVTKLAGLSCKEFKIFRNSDVYRCGTLELNDKLNITAGTKIATHYTDYTYKNGELIINQNLKWLVDTTCNYSTMAMLGVRRASENKAMQISNKGLREGEGVVYDCSVADFNNALSVSLDGCKKAYLWNDGTVTNNSGWDCSFMAEVLEETQLEGKNFKVSNHDSYNKMYFGYCKEGQVVKKGDVWHSKAKYKIDFNGEY